MLPDEGHTGSIRLRAGGKPGAGPETGEQRIVVARGVLPSQG